MATLLIVESDRITAELLAKHLTSDGRPHRILVAIDPDEARIALDTDSPDLVLVRYGPMTDRLDDLLTVYGDRPPVLVHGVRSDWHDTDELPPWADGVLRGDMPAEEFLRQVEERLTV